MNKHTKGPWYLTVERLHGVYVESRPLSDNGCGEGDCICVVTKDEDTLPTIANANLIAAAPELLEALEELVEATLIIAPEASCKPALAAIAKAKGEQL